MDEQKRELISQFQTASDPRERMKILRKLEDLEKGSVRGKGNRSNRKSGGGPLTLSIISILGLILAVWYTHRVSKEIPRDTVSVSTVTALVRTLLDSEMKTVSDSLSKKVAEVRTKPEKKTVKKTVANRTRKVKKRKEKKSSSEVTVAKSEQGKTKTLQPDTLPASDTIPKPDTLLTSESDTLPVSDTLASDTLSKSDTLAADTLPKDKLTEQGKEKKIAEPGKGVTLTVKASQDMARIFFNRVWAKERYRSGSNPVFQKVPPSTFRINVENEAGLWSADAASLAQGSSHFEVTVNGMKMVKMEDNGEGGANFVFTINPDGTISP